jgi:NAD(P)H dehydrogenase (quinone)
LGRRVVELLLARNDGARIIAATRKPAGLADLAARGVEVRHGDFDDETSLQSAFRGVAHALIVSTDAVGEPGKRAAQHARAVQALASAGVKHIVYTSIVNPVGSKILLSRDHADTEAALAKSGVPFTALRNNVYSDYQLPNLQRALASGTLVDARAAGKVGFVTREDCARIAAAVVAAPPSGSQALDVTGPESLSSADLAALLSQLGGRKVEHQSIPLNALIDGMVQHGLPRPLAEIYASFDTGIAAGELDVASDAVMRHTGTKPQSMGDFLRANKAAWSA